MTETTTKKSGIGKRLLFVTLGVGCARRIYGLFRSLLWNNASQWGYTTSREALRRLRSKPQERRGESFLEACERLGVSAADLEARREWLLTQAFIGRLFAYLSLLGGIASGIFAEGFWWFLAMTANGLTIAAMFFAVAFARVFRAWQIEQKNLLPVSAFLREGGLYRAVLW